MKCPNCGKENFIEMRLYVPSLECNCSEAYGLTKETKVNLGIPFSDKKEYGGQNYNTIRCFGFNCDAKCYVCRNCGRIEFYSNYPEIQEKLRIEKEKREKEEKDKNDFINSLKKEIEDLKLIVKDENRTVKEVKEASERLSVAENKLKNIK